jgi:hypothetical protein
MSVATDFRHRIRIGEAAWMVWLGRGVRGIVWQASATEE